MKEPRGERLFRAWSEVEPPAGEAGRDRFLEVALRTPRRAAPRLQWLAAAAVLLAVLGYFGTRPTALHFSTATGEGAAGTWLATDATRELPLTFSEGTQVTIAADSRGRVEELDPRGASFLLERGEVRAHVVHRSDTHWRFLAGPYEVRVTGTSLGVRWDPARERVVVFVDEGSVIVHGPHDSVQTVRAGERYVAEVAGAMGLATPDAGVLAELADAGGAPLAAIAPSVAPSPRPSAEGWLTFEERGDYDGAYAAAKNAGLSSVLRASSSDELLRLAQVGQLSGHRDTERSALLACRRRFPNSEPAAVAAYELGRAASTTEAATWFETYLREAPRGALAREALGRLLEARASSHDPAAREAATRYLAADPQGPHAALARRVLAESTE